MVWRAHQGKDLGLAHPEASLGRGVKPPGPSPSKASPDASAVACKGGAAGGLC